MTGRRVSVIVNTFNRAASLRRTLDAFVQLEYDDFEVVVVNGPSSDETEEVLADFANSIKVGRCENRNLSESRNIGIALAAGEIVAFIDDDAYPDPAWLDRLAEAYDDGEVAAAGGPVYDYTGARLQARYSMASRFGKAWTPDALPPAALCQIPYALDFPYTIGTNSSFRRDLVVEIGGFDEEFEYYLDETDLCCRLIDRGYIVKPLADGYVYHKFLPSEIRGANRAIHNWYPVMKNRCYFALKHGLVAASFYEVCDELAKSIEFDRGGWKWMLDRDLVSTADYDRWLEHIPAAFNAGFESFRRGSQRTRPAEWFCRQNQPFKAFATVRPPGKRLHLCLFTEEYPPLPMNGIARVIHALATGLAAEGHMVEVLTRGEDHDRVDLEDGVWVHRIVVSEHLPPASLDVPGAIWNYSASLLEELVRIDAHRPVDVVHVPNWNSEGVAVVADGRFRTVVGLYTPIKTVATIDDNLVRAGGLDDPFVRQLVDLERWIYERADGLLACGPEIVEEIEDRYDLTLGPVGFVRHGLADTSASASTSVSTAAVGDNVEVLFVGRLEKRKGIDVLLECIPPLVATYPNVVFTIAGNDAIPGPGGVPYRRLFEGATDSEVSGRVRFAGVVSDTELGRLYASCDVFVAPSRFESFGLIFVEAMMHGKPVIGCRAGGIPSIIEDGGNGILVPPGDAEALEQAIGILVGDPDRRRAFGLRSRQLYETKFSARRMAQEAGRYYGRVAGRKTVSSQKAASR